MAPPDGRLWPGTPAGAGPSRFAVIVAAMVLLLPAALLERCAELLGVDLDTIGEAATHVEPYLRVDGTKVWSLMQLERHLRPDAYGRVQAAISPAADHGHQGREPVTDAAGHCSFCGAPMGPSPRSRGCSRC